jgi:magnesium chelatase family protein
MQQVDKNDKPSISSKEMHQQVIEAHKFAKKREQKEFNAKLSDKDIEVYCTMDDEATDLLEIAITRFNLSFRSIKKVRKVARSIADLVCSDMIKKEHIMEALSYRKR